MQGAARSPTAPEVWRPLAASKDYIIFIYIYIYILTNISIDIYDIRHKIITHTQTHWGAAEGASLRMNGVECDGLSEVSFNVLHILCVYRKHIYIYIYIYIF